MKEIEDLRMNIDGEKKKKRRSEKRQAKISDKTTSKQNQSIVVTAEENSKTDTRTAKLAFQGHNDGFFLYPPKFMDFKENTLNKGQISEDGGLTNYLSFSLYLPQKNNIHVPLLGNLKDHKISLSNSMYTAYNDSNLTNIAPQFLDPERPMGGLTAGSYTVNFESSGKKSSHFHDKISFNITLGNLDDTYTNKLQNGFHNLVGNSDIFNYKEYPVETGFYKTVTAGKSESFTVNLNQSENPVNLNFNINAAYTIGDYRGANIGGKIQLGKGQANTDISLGTEHISTPSFERGGWFVDIRYNYYNTKHNRIIDGSINSKSVIIEPAQVATGAPPVDHTTETTIYKTTHIKKDVHELALTAGVRIGRTMIEMGISGNTNAVGSFERVTTIKKKFSDDNFFWDTDTEFKTSRFPKWDANAGINITYNLGGKPKNHKKHEHKNEISVLELSGLKNVAISNGGNNSADKVIPLDTPKNDSEINHDNTQNLKK